jgi:hypothetical protein
MKKMKLIPEGKNVRLKIDSAIDESCEFPDQVACDTIRVDLDSLKLFNSLGIRLWLNWTREKRGFKSMKLDNCRPCFIRQVRHIPHVIPAFAQVASFFVPYYNAQTDETTEVLMVFGKDYDETKFTVPQVKNAAGEPLELDVADNYFDFLKAK